MFVYMFLTYWRNMFGGKHFTLEKSVTDSEWKFQIINFYFVIISENKYKL